MVPKVSVRPSLASLILVTLPLRLIYSGVNVPLFLLLSSFPFSSLSPLLALKLPALLAGLPFLGVMALGPLGLREGTPSAPLRLRFSNLGLGWLSRDCVWPWET